MARPRPVLLLILDGWGHRDDNAHNAIAEANAPNWRRLLRDYPHTLVETHGAFVGLPDGQMGNSEVGHMNIGSGRIVYQDLTRIDAAIGDGSFFDNPALAGACDAAKRAGGTLNVLGLVSPGGVHSHEDHILAMLDLAARRGVSRIAVHAFLDGRDTPPRSARASLEKLQAKCASIAGAFVASVCGRYYAMDRDKRWDRVKLAYDAIANGESPFHAETAVAALERAYARGENDEFVKPTVIGDGSRIADGDAIVFMNFRADRARQLSHAFVDADFSGFQRERKIALSAFVTLTDYEKDLAVSAIAYPAQSMHNSLGEYLSSLGLTQLRIAETEKYAHVTFFFSGGREAPFAGEQRILVPSPHVATYDLKPEMSCPELTDRLVEAIASAQFDFIVCNIANADMVGHTGIEAAAIKAVEAIDVALGRITQAIVAAGGEMLISADHGNLEQMLDANGVPHTQHTVGPVPLVYVGRKARLQRGSLRDLAPTVLALMDLPQPPEMTGHNLVGVRGLILRVALLLSLALSAAASLALAEPASEATDAQHAAEERAARQKLDAVRGEIKALAEQQRATEDARSDASRALRAKETELAGVARDVHALDEKIDAQQAELDKLDARRAGLETVLKTQRDALAALLRSAYALGRNEELKLLLQQNDVAAIARVLAYNRYFQRARIGRIDQLSVDLEQLANVQASIRQKTAELATTRDARAAEGTRLENERSERAALLDQLDGKLKEQGARAAALGKDEKALGSLLEKLRDVFADIPKTLAGAEPFASMRGHLAWPLQGKLVTGFGAADESGRRSSGFLVAAKNGTAVHAVSHGRVVFADWLRGYGLIIIVDHGDGYLSLYGCNETLLKDVGDWVNAGETIATSGSSGGQKTAGLYFELRAKGQPVDPKGWLR